MKKAFANQRGLQRSTGGGLRAFGTTSARLEVGGLGINAREWGTCETCMVLWTAPRMLLPGAA